MQEKNNSMRKTLAQIWGVDEGKNPFDKEEEKTPKKRPKTPVFPHSFGPTFRDEKAPQFSGQKMRCFCGREAPVFCSLPLFTK